MIKTLGGNNSSFAGVGKVAIQPAARDSSQFMINSQTTPTNTQQPLPASQISLAATAIVAKENVLMTLAKPSIEGLTTQLFTANGSLIIPLMANMSKLIPTHDISLDSAKIFDPRTTQSFINTPTKFQPFEQLTGIAHERPEIIMLTNIEPLFNNDAAFASPVISTTDSKIEYSQEYMTPAGKFAEAQIQMRNLISWDMQHTIDASRRKFHALNQQLTQRSSDFTQGLLRLDTNAKYLLNLIRILDEQKNQLDLRHKIHKVNPRKLMQYVTSKYAPALRSTYTLTAGTKMEYDCADCLIDLGYTATNVKSVFSSTKIWMQTLVELKALLKNHSHRLIDIDPAAQRSDSNPTSILQPQPKYFTIEPNLPEIPSLTELINLDVNNLTKTMSMLNPVFISMYQNVFFKNEEARLASLACLLTQEFRYSRGLSKSTVVTALQNFYGFNVALNGNTTLFDAIFGNFGNNIIDFPAASDQSLASIAQNTIGRGNEEAVGILTFESKYIEGDSGTLTPGGEFFIDRVLNTTGDKFSTSQLVALSTQLDDQLTQLNTIIDGMNLFSFSTSTDIELNGVKRNQSGGFLTSAYDTINEIANKLINTKTGFPQKLASNDKLSTVYTRARSDNNVKTMLFLYTIAKISRTYNKNVPFFASRAQADNTPLVDALIDKIVNAIDAAVQENRTTFQLVTQKMNGIAPTNNSTSTASSVTKDNIKYALKTGTEISSIVEQFMSSVISQFSLESSAVQNSRTRYSGYLDTIIMMMAFDFAIAMVARYGDQSIVGAYGGLASTTRGMTVYAVSNTYANHVTSFNELMRRVTDEAHQAQQLLLAIINVLRNVSGSLRGLSNYLNSNEAIAQLNEIAAVLKNDKDLIRMLVSEQQIMMLASTVESLISATTAKSMGTSYHNDQDSSEAVVVLDDSVITPQSREALYSLFNSSELASKSSVNKRLLTVGIPLGFSRRLKQKINISTQTNASFQGKQSDIIRVNVYKVDLQNADIVYKPQKFIYELSRFPVRSSTGAWLKLKPQATLRDIVHAIPTHNFEAGSALLSTDTRTPSVIEYASSSEASHSNVRSSREAFSDASYNFLTQDEKSEILQNHVMSQLLEIYVKIMTGMNVAEYNFDVKQVPEPIESEFVKTLAEHTMQYIVDQTTNHNGLSKPTVQPPKSGVLFANNRLGQSSNSAFSNIAGTPGRVNASTVYSKLAQTSAPTISTQEQSVTLKLATNLTTMRHNITQLAFDNFRAVSVTKRTWTNFSSVEALMQRIMMPKQFDRVFNLLIDPRDFEIDVENTISTPYGQQAFELLINRGDILPVEIAAGNQSNSGTSASASNKRASGTSRAVTSGIDPNINNFKYRDRDKNQGDLISDKYFITIETYSEGII